MTATYDTTTATARLQVAADRIASKTIASATGTALTATLVVGTSSLSGSTGVLATYTITTAVTSGVSGKVLTIPLAATSVNGSAAGTAAKAEVRNNAGTVILGPLSVGTSGSGADVIIDNTSISLNQPVVCLSATITHP